MKKMGRLTEGGAATFSCPGASERVIAMAIGDKIKNDAGR